MWADGDGMRENRVGEEGWHAGRRIRWKGGDGMWRDEKD